MHGWRSWKIDSGVECGFNPGGKDPYKSVASEKSGGGGAGGEWQLCRLWNEFDKEFDSIGGEGRTVDAV